MKKYLIIVFLFCSCSSFNNKTAESNKSYRSIASYGDDQCIDSVIKIIDFDQEKVEIEISKSIDKFWKKTLSDNADGLTLFGKYEYYTTLFLQRLNHNPQPVFFVEDSEKSFVVISTIKKYFKGKGLSAGNNADELMPIDEAKSLVNKWSNRYSLFIGNVNFLKKKYITLKFQIKKLKKQFKYNQYPFEIDLFVFKKGQQPFKQKFQIEEPDELSELITKLENQKNLIASPVFGNGYLKSLQIRQAEDYERLKRTYRVVKNIYLNRDKSSNLPIDKELNEIYFMLKKIVHDSNLKPHRSFRRKLISKSKLLEWNQLRLYLVSLKDNDKIVKIREFFDSFTDEQIEAMGLTEKKKRWEKTKQNFKSKKLYIWSAAAMSGTTGTGYSGYIYFLRDYAMADTLEKQKCYQAESSDEFDSCVNKYMLKNFEVSNAIVFINNGYKGLLQILQNDPEKFKKFQAMSDYFKLARQEYLETSTRRRVEEEESKREMEDIARIEFMAKRKNRVLVAP